MSRGVSCDLAIVGMSCRTPGAPDLFAWWAQVLAGPESVRADADNRAPDGLDVVGFALSDAGLSPEDGRAEILDGPDAIDLAGQALAAHEVQLAVARERQGSDEAAIVLKRLADAERDGDRIYAVVRQGVASPGILVLIKSALALHHRILPPDLHEARPWIHDGASGPRRVELGSGVMVEEHAASADGEPNEGRPGQGGAMLHWETEAILLAADDRASLADRVRALLAWLGEHPGAALKDIAYTLGDVCVSSPGDVRLGLVASSPAELAARLGVLVPRLEAPTCPAIGDARGTYYGEEPLAGPGRLAFLFPGEGSQYPGMLADLCPHFPEVRRQFDTADRIARELGDALPPSAHVFGRADGSDAPAGLWSAPTAVNVVLNAQWALYQVLTRLGIHPDAVAGHSSGEILALAAAGVLRADRELERQLGRLGAIFRDLESTGGLPVARLIAVAANRRRVEEACKAVGARGVDVAIDNCPHQVVLAGSPAEIERVSEHLRGQNILMEVLPFDRAYHTSGFAPVLGPISESFAGLTFRAPGRPVYSCATTSPMPAEPAAIRDLAVSQWTRTVAFRETVERMYADGLRIFVDVGARGNLASFVQDTLRGRSAFAIAANLPRRGGPTQLNHLVAALFAQGVPVRPGFLFARRRPRRLGGLVDETAARASIATELGLPSSAEWAPPVIPIPSRQESAVPSRGQPHREAVALTDERTPRWALPDNVAAEPISNPARLSVTLPLRDELLPSPEPFPRWTLPDVPPYPSEGDQPIAPSGVEAAMLAFQETMRAFLETQSAVIGAYLGHAPVEDEADAEGAEFSPLEASGSTSGRVPGPWVGEVLRLVPGLEIESRYILDVRRDPIAEHHTLGGRKVSALDTSLRGLPVLPFAVMAEMTVQASALIVSPGLVLTRLESVHAHKWVRYEDEPVVLEMRGRREPSSDDPSGEQRVHVAIFNRGASGRQDAARAVFEAVAVFAAATPEPPRAEISALENARPSRFTAESIYREQWLFHGPVFQAVSDVGATGPGGIDGALRVLPLEPLVEGGHESGSSNLMHTDVIVIDSFTHLLGCWGLDEMADRGDVMFPLGIHELAIFGGRPEVGTEVSCRVRIEELERHRVRISAEIARPDGSLWMRLRDWEDWRFHWPGRYRDVFRQPRDVFAGEEVASDGSGNWSLVWMEPPGDMGRPVWRDVLEATQLGPAERSEHLAQGGGEERRSHRLWGRIAAKEAARRIWKAEGRAPVYPADLAIVLDEVGTPMLARVDHPSDRSLPAIAIALADGVAVAIAVRDPGARPRIAVERIPRELDESGPAAASPGVATVHGHSCRRGEYVCTWTLGGGTAP